MKVLWLINIVLPEIAEEFGQPVTPSGGWLVNMAKEISNSSEYNLGICFPIAPNQNTDYSKKIINNVTYYPFEDIRIKVNYDTNIENKFYETILDFSPDVVHIWGTEYLHSLAMINACEKQNLLNRTVVSIQGLVSVYYKHYYSNIPLNVRYGFTLRDFLRKDNIFLASRKFLQRGKYEVQALSKACNIIGRTDWDKACTQQINPSAKYFICNETLRDAFYENTWQYDKCEHYSIFVSQCQYPLKGFHNVLMAMPIILKSYPDTKVYTTGPNLINISKLSDKLRLTSYQKYLIRLIDKYNLKDNIVFLGKLDEENMCNRFIKSNVFVSPSSIENSPNSVGEAMLLGVPVVSSDVGGVKSMLIHEKEGFVFQSDAPYMLAYYVCQIFGNKKIGMKFSEEARKHALVTHNRKKNLNDLVDIYNSIRYNII